jgi:hypothetical protein
MGDAQDFGVQGFVISFHIEDGLGNGIPNIPASDFWLDDVDPVNDLIVLCGGSSSSSADSLTNSLGNTTMSQTSIAAGKCALGVIAIVQGSILEDNTCTVPRQLPVYVKSFDMSGDLGVDLGDFSLFVTSWPTTPGYVYNPCSDYRGINGNDLADLATFAFHFPVASHVPPVGGCQ